MQRSGGPCRIAGVIPTYNRRDLLERCLGALLRQTRPLDEILVIDNASTDGTGQMVRDKFPAMTDLVRLEKNTGSAGGFSKGFAVAYDRGYDWMWAMDNDAEPAPDALQELVNCPYFNDPGTGLLGSLVVDRDGRVQPSHHIRLTRLMKELPVTGERCDTDAPIGLDAKSYTGSLIRRDAVAAVGLPNSAFFVYQDDWDYSHRIAMRFKVLLVPRSRVVHGDGKRNAPQAPRLHRALRPSFDERWKVYYSLRNNAFFMTRHAKVWVRPFVVAKVLCIGMKKVMGVLIFDNHKWQWAGLLLWAFKDGLAGQLGKRA
ncbi:MAG: glycosyltransferase family 2 protein [Terriglobia bacterium]